MCHNAGLRISAKCSGGNRELQGLLSAFLHTFIELYTQVFNCYIRSTVFSDLACVGEAVSVLL